MLYWYFKPSTYFICVTYPNSMIPSKIIINIFNNPFPDYPYENSFLFSNTFNLFVLLLWHIYTVLFHNTLCLRGLSLTYIINFWRMQAIACSYPCIPKTWANYLPQKWSWINIYWMCLYIEFFLDDVLSLLSHVLEVYWNITMSSSMVCKDIYSYINWSQTGTFLKFLLLMVDGCRWSCCAIR